MVEHSRMDPNPLTIAPDWKDVPTHAKRAFKPDFGAGVASEAERGNLPGLGKQAQDFLTWRRSGLMIAVVMLTVSAATSFVDFGLHMTKKEEGTPFQVDTELVNGMQASLVAAKCFLAAMAFQAWKSWRDLPRSHRRIKLGWVVGLLVPFVIALVPLSEILKLGGPGQQLGAEQAMGLQFMGLLLGLTSFLTLLPSVISVFVGAVRAGLLTTRFLPESPIPGAVVGVAAPVLALLLLAIFVLLNQVVGSTLMLIGFAAVILNFLLYARFGPRLARSYRREELEAEFGHLRNQSALLLGGGAVCIVISLFTTQLFGKHLVGFGENSVVGVLKLLEFVVELVGKSTITMLLFSDFLISGVRHSRAVAPTFEGSPLAKELDARLEELKGAGVTAIAELGRFRTGDSAAIPGKPS